MKKNEYIPCCKILMNHVENVVFLTPAANKYLLAYKDIDTEVSYHYESLSLPDLKHLRIGNWNILNREIFEKIQSKIS